MKLSQRKADWIRRWMLENVSSSIKIISVGVSDHYPLIKDPQMDYEREMNQFEERKIRLDEMLCCGGK